jgi:hypothetical protein
MTIADDVALTLTLFMREATPVRPAYPGVKASEPSPLFECAKLLSPFAR